MRGAGDSKRHLWEGYGLFEDGSREAQRRPALAYDLPPRGNAKHTAAEAGDVAKGTRWTCELAGESIGGCRKTVNWPSVASPVDFTINF